MRQTLIMASLSSKKRPKYPPGSSRSHISNAGASTVRHAWCVASISAAGVDVATEPYLTDFPKMGKRVMGPSIAKCIPVVDRWDSAQPPKSASA